MIREDDNINAFNQLAQNNKHTNKLFYNEGTIIKVILVNSTLATQ